MKTVILGAGATRGASFVRDRICKPPLNTDFFEQLQKIQDEKNKTVVKQVIKDAVKLFGPNFILTLEEFFTYMEGFINIIKLVKKETRQYRLEELETIRRNFFQAIASVFEESLCDSIGSRYNAQKCDFHESLVHSLKNGDAILSFNYDCLIDQHLRNYGKDKWCAKYGYGLPMRGLVFSGFEAWETNPPYINKNTISLLKLHGSLNWQIVEKKNRRTIHLKERPYTRQQGEIKFSIIPPEAHKTLIPPYAQLWKKAASMLRRTDELVFIGYSFVDTDMESTSLFRMMTNPKLKSLIIVNPDKNARRKTKQILINSISDSTIVLMFDDLQEYSKYLDFNLLKMRCERKHIETATINDQPMEQVQNGKIDS